MALITCKDCNNNFSTDASRCPSCGARKPSNLGRTLVITFLIIFVIGFYGATHPSNNTISIKDTAPISSEEATKLVSKCFAQNIKYGGYSSYDGGKSALKLMTDCPSASVAWIKACVREHVNADNNQSGCQLNLGLFAGTMLRLVDEGTLNPDQILSQSDDTNTPANPAQPKFEGLISESKNEPSTEQQNLTPTIKNSASFDCGKAHSTVEILICSDSNLSALDWQVGQQFALQKAGTFNATQTYLNLNKQRTFLKNRTAACPIAFQNPLPESESKNIIACLKYYYQNRLATLQAENAAASN